MVGINLFCVSISSQAWDASNGQEIFTIPSNRDVIRSLAISNDNKIFASGSDNGSVEVRTKSIIHELHVS